MSDIERVEEGDDKIIIPRRHLTGADAAVIFGLLVFILAWVGGWIWGLEVTNFPADKNDVKWWVAVFLLIIIAGPAMWAAGVIKHIVGKED